jgi:hypothetical protein
MDIESELVRLEETRIERLSLSRLLKISHRLKRHLAIRGVPFFEEMSNQTFADWSRRDAEKLLDLWRAVAVLNECQTAILIASLSRKSGRTSWMVWEKVSFDTDYGIQLLESYRFGIFPEKVSLFSQLPNDQRRRHDDDQTNAAQPARGQGMETEPHGNQRTNGGEPPQRAQEHRPQNLAG